MNKGDRILELEKNIKHLERKIQDADQIMKDLAKQIKTDSMKLADLKNTLNQLIPGEVTISDHAVLRYLERHVKINVEAYRDEIKNIVGSSNISELKFRGFTLKNNTVVTYIPEY